MVFTNNELENMELVLGLLAALANPDRHFLVPGNGDGKRMAGKIVDDNGTAYIVFSPVNEIADTTVINGQKVKVNHG